MWVCHCNAVSDKTFIEAIKKTKKDNGGEPPKLCDAYKEATGGKGPVCGTCIETVKSYIKNTPV